MDTDSSTTDSTTDSGSGGKWTPPSDRRGPQTKDRWLSLRLNEDLRTGLEQLAARNERTLAGEIRFALRRHIDLYDPHQQHAAADRSDDDDADA
jgi:TraY domain